MRTVKKLSYLSSVLEECNLQLARHGFKARCVAYYFPDSRWQIRSDRAQQECDGVRIVVIIF